MSKNTHTHTQKHKRKQKKERKRKEKNMSIGRSLPVNQKKKEKKKKRRRRGNDQEEGKKKNEEEQCEQSPCATVHGHFRPKMMPNFSLQFSSHFEKKTFWWAYSVNTAAPQFIFLPPHPTQHTPKKNFLSIFSSKFSIHLISPSNKHTLND